MAECTAERIQQELARGVAAREAGLEGRARVCARRAAGEAVRAYFLGLGRPVDGLTAYDLLLELAGMPGVEAVVRQAAQRLSMRVNEAYQLPVEADLLADARQIARALGLLDDATGMQGAKETNE